MIETYQMFLQKACLATVGVFAIGALAFSSCLAMRGLYTRIRRTGRLNVIFAFLAIGAMVVYGGKKPSPPIGPDDPPPSSDDPVPGTDDPASGSDDPPSSDDPEPGTDDPAPGSDDPEPGTDDPAPGSDDPAPGSDDPVPGTDDPAPGSDDPVPSVEYRLYKVVTGAAPDDAASEYNGYLYSGNGDAKGSIQIKVGKPNKNTRQASVKATVLLNGKKISLKAAENGKAEVAAGGPTSVSLVGRGADACSVKFGQYGLSGRYGVYDIDGARNLFVSKDKEEQRSANGLLEDYLGPVNVVWDGGSASVAIAKKGKAKATGSLAGGAKISASGMFLCGEKFCCVPVVAQKSPVAFNVWIDEAGTVAAIGLDGDVIAAGAPESLRAGSKFSCSGESPLWGLIKGRALTEYLPDGVDVVQSGTRWTLPKAGKLSMKNGVVDDSKAGENPSALKLTYKAKDGSFKGSFKVYADNGGRLKATTVNVTGVMVGGVGYGTASVKNVGQEAVSVSRATK